MKALPFSCSRQCDKTGGASVKPKLMVCLIVLLSRAAMAGVSPEEEFQRGKLLFHESAYAAASAAFGKLNADMNTSAEFNYYHGLSLLKSDRSGEAIPVIKRAIGIEPGNAEYRYALALAYAARMSEMTLLRAAMTIGPARETLFKAVELDPHHVGATRSLVELLLDVPGALGGNDKTARDLITKLWTLDPATAAAMEAKLATRGGNREQTEKLLLQAVEHAR